MACNDSVRRQLTEKMFLELYEEDGLTEEQLKEKLLNEYVAAGYYYKSYDDITIEDKEHAVYQFYNSAGFNFNSFDDIINYDINENPVKRKTFKTYEKLIKDLSKNHYIIYT